ncbi:glycosyltransferase family 2 protein [Paenibacillus sp. SZ31]|uniref:glycosyltransferase family 2 protein n=1 Tax=Paenibacillus sp. SZ31 TaxID=2725555 RepID=UPI00146B0E8C|nr:glycosyltransferase family 2 protein [Paenibacillus sp. SZ31]NMI03855.1 glycosyltransferase family 2 protein [Paenibacillus sp. SZ31]
MDPVVTVIVPVYKTEEYLRVCLNSLLTQTLTDIQVVVVNDCSPDNSKFIIEEFVGKDERFEVVNHSINKGVGAARNSGLKKARGEYITFLDSDDSYPLDALRRMYETIKCSNADVVLGKMYEKGIDGDLTPVNYIEKKINEFLKIPYSNLRKIPPNKFYCGSATHQMFKRSLFLKNKITFMEGVYHEDIPFTLETWFYANKIVITNCIVLYRTIRQNNDNLSATQTFNLKAFEDREKIILYIYNFCLKFARTNNDLIDLSLEILHRINGTTDHMLLSVEDKDRNIIIKAWHPKYLKVYNHIVNDIRALNLELEALV